MSGQVQGPCGAGHSGRVRCPGAVSLTASASISAASAPPAHRRRSAGSRSLQTQGAAAARPRCPGPDPRIPPDPPGTCGPAAPLGPAGSAGRGPSAAMTRNRPEHFRGAAHAQSAGGGDSKGRASAEQGNSERRARGERGERGHWAQNTVGTPRCGDSGHIDRCSGAGPRDASVVTLPKGRSHVTAR